MALIQGASLTTKASSIPTATSSLSLAAADSALGKGGNMTQFRVLTGTSVKDMTRSLAKFLNCSRTSVNSPWFKPRHSIQNALGATAPVGGALLEAGPA